MSNSWLIAILIALVIIVALAFYAGTLLKRLKNQTNKQLQQETLKHHALQKHDHKIFSSVIIIVRAMKAQQCDICEGSWRLCVLLDSLKLSDTLKQNFPAIFALYGKIKHLAILDARKKLNKQERMKQDLTRIKAETEYEEAIKTDLETLFQYSNERLSMLSLPASSPKQ